MEEKEKTERPTVKAEVLKFTKDKILSMSPYRHRRDILKVILKDGQVYTTKDVDAALEKFMKGKVR